VSLAGIAENPVTGFIWAASIETAVHMPVSHGSLWAKVDVAGMLVKLAAGITTLINSVHVQSLLVALLV